MTTLLCLRLTDDAEVGIAVRNLAVALAKAGFKTAFLNVTDYVPGWEGPDANSLFTKRFASVSKLLAETDVPNLWYGHALPPTEVPKGKMPEACLLANLLAIDADYILVLADPYEGPVLEVLRKSSDIVLPLYGPGVEKISQVEGLPRNKMPSVVYFRATEGRNWGRLPALVIEEGMDDEEAGFRIFASIVRSRPAF